MQNYISSELCHFVGRSKKSDEERMDLLKLIINSGRLIADINNPDNPEIVSHNQYFATRLGEIYEKNDVVCFCDIPRSDLNIHTKKYSKFGISFSKTFIASHGGRPVTYVPNNFNIDERAETINPKEPAKYFTSVSNHNHNIGSIMMLFNQVFNFSELLNKLKTVIPTGAINIFDNNVVKKIENGESHQILYSQQTAITTMLAFIKLFDCELDSDHIDNYYMEREWRILDNLSFDLDDIKCIFLPNESFKRSFLEDFPNYKADIYLLED